jgi:uncharacterized protein YxjI
MQQAIERPVWWSVDRVLMRRKVLAIAPQFEVYAPDGGLLLYCHQKIFKLREDMRVYADRSRQHEILTIKARQIIDFSAAYDVVDSQQDIKVGALRRRGLRSLVRDHWDILDARDGLLGAVTETGPALLRRLFSFLPQSYEFTFGASVVARVSRSWNPFVFKAWMDMTEDPERRFDRRLALAAGLLLMAIEGRADG